MPLSEVILLPSGHALPSMRVSPPGPLSKAWVRRAEKVESPAFQARRALREEASGHGMGPIVYAAAIGSNVLDVDGNVYVDLTAGFGAELLGHQHPHVASAVAAQSSRLWHALGDVYTADARIALMEELAALYPQPGARVILGQSGADAVTAALKTALLSTGKPGVIAFEGSYHGMSYGPLAATGLRASYRDPFAAQLSPHVTFVPYPREVVSLAPRDAAAKPIEEDSRGRVTSEQVLAQVAKRLEGGDVGAILIEPILGRGGCWPAAPGFLRALETLAKAAGALLIADEIWTGLGRSGAMLASADEGVCPDLICLGKGLGGGLPISACIGRDDVMAAWGRGPDEVVHTATFHGAPIACAGALATLSVLRSEGLAARAREVGERWMNELETALRGLAPSVGVKQVRGRGLMIGIEITGDGRALAVSRELLARGYIVLTGGTRGETLTLTPPLVIDTALLSAFGVALCETLAKLDAPKELAMSTFTQTVPDMDARAAASDELHSRVRAFARESLAARGWVTTAKSGAAMHAPVGSIAMNAITSAANSSGDPEMDAIDEGWDPSDSKQAVEIQEGLTEDEAFDDLACDIARYQAVAGVSLIRLFKARGISMSKLVRASDIPAIPSDAFRMTRISVHAKRLDARTFRTSGTTSGARGEHTLRTLATYREVASLWASCLLIPREGVARVVALMPSPAELQDSSLGYMCELFGELVASASGGTSWHIRNGEIDVASVETAIEEARQKGVPVLLLGASFALVHLLDALAGRVIALPPDSRVMLTGGFKGKSREVSEAELRATLGATFAVPTQALIGEYGMTELSSQAYEFGGVPSVYHSPPWMRVVAVDPVSLAPVPRGEIGIARIVDLANVDSAVVIQTQDRVRVRSDASFELLGRLEGGTPRGCSLLIEELLG